MIVYFISLTVCWPIANRDVRLLQRRHLPLFLLADLSVIHFITKKTQLKFRIALSDVHVHVTFTRNSLKINQVELLMKNIYT